MVLAMESGIPFGVWAGEDGATVVTAIEFLTPKPGTTSIVKG